MRLKFFLILNVFFLSSCRVTYEQLGIMDVRQRVVKNPAAQEDEANVFLHFSTEGKEEKEKRHILYKSPYDPDISVTVSNNKLGVVRDIEFKEIYFEIVYKNKPPKTVSLDLDKKKWVKKDYLREKYSLVTGAHLQKMNFIDIDFKDLKEVRFYGRFIGVYDNGVRRAYEVERYLEPKRIIQKQHPIETYLLQ